MMPSEGLWDVDASCVVWKGQEKTRCWSGRVSQERRRAARASSSSGAEEWRQRQRRLRGWVVEALRVVGCYRAMKLTLGRRWSR